MRQSAAFIKKEFAHILRDRWTMLILFGIPVILIVLFGFALSVEINNVDVGVAGDRTDNEVRRLVNKIESNSYFNVVDFVTDYNEVERLMQRNEVDVVLAFGDGFSSKGLGPDKKTVSIITDASNPNQASAMTMYLTQVIQDYFKGQDDVAAPIEVNVRHLYNPQMKSSYNFVPGIMGMILLLVGALMTSVSIVREKETGTMEELLVSPVSPLTIVVAKMVPYFVISFAALLLVLLLSYLLLDVPLSGSISLIILVSVIYILLSLSLGLMVSVFAKTQLVAMVVSGMLFMVPIMLLSGMMFPIESMPGILRLLSNVVPARWYVSAMRKLMIEGLPFVYVAKETLILLGMTAFLLFVSLKNFKYRLE